MARIVFDLDGTLIDSAQDILGVANAVLAQEKLTLITLEQSRNFVGNGAAVFVERMRAARGVPASEQDRLFSDFVALYENAVTLTVTYEGVHEALADLISAGNRLGICTNKPIRPTKAVISHLKLDQFFEIVLGGDSLPVHKPDPAPLIATFEELGEGPMYFVGDSEVDEETAHRAKIPFLLYTEGYRKSPVATMRHQLSFSDFRMLPELVSQLLEEAS